MVRRDFPLVRVVVNEQNYGFAKTNNIGIKYTCGKYICLLNNDTILRNNAFKIFWEYMESIPDVGICGGTLFYPNGDRQVSYGNYPSLTEAFMGALFLPELFPNALWVRRKGITPQNEISSPTEVEYICGADLFIRRKIVEEFGLFDETFVAYCEESDFCTRVHQSRRWKIRFIPQAEISHRIAFSYNAIPDRKIRMLFRSYNIYLRKYHNRLYVLLVRFLYAWQYWVKLIVRFVILMTKPISASRAKLLEAWYMLKYSIASPTIADSMSKN